METHKITSDGELLRYYVHDKCEAAFAHIGRRYAGLVYSVCLRELHDPTLAEDAAQATFLLLAQKAASLTRHKSVAGWLFNAARLTSQNLRRQEARRKLYEDKAAQFMEMRQAQNGQTHTTENRLWEETEPHLNDALTHLKEGDREAVLLRFFEGRSLAEVGARLGVSENTARMRIARALEKMRISLRKAGIAVSAASLAALLSDRAALSSKAAPDALHHSIAQIGAASLSAGAGAAGGLAVSASALAALKGTLQIMAMTTAKKAGVAAGVALLGLFLGGAAITVLHSDRNAAHPSFFSFWSKPVDPVIEKMTAPFVGKWEGASQNLNVASGQWQKTPVTITFSRSSSGLALDFGGKAPAERYDFDAANNSCTETGAQGVAQYKMTGMQEFARRGAGTFTMVTTGTPNPATGEMRGTVTLEGDTLTLVNERLMGDKYQVVSRQTYQKANGQ